MLSERLKRMKERVRAGEHKSLRRPAAFDVREESRGLSWMRRSALITQRTCEVETPVIGPDERILFTRTVTSVPIGYDPEEWRERAGDAAPHEAGPINNICADWGMVLSQGLLGRRRAAEASLKAHAGDPEAVEFLTCAIATIDAVLELATRYAAAAREAGNDLLAWVPAHPPRTFHEALQALRFCHSMVWLSGHYHVGLGRLDQYLWPYLKADLDRGLSREEAEELLAEFFISLNRDSDLYPGVQQGDNGQSLMLGGVTPDGADAVNELTYMALRAARDVGMIDPKINLRVSRDTPIELLELATQLTRMGLGFPQYSNDEVVIPALVASGYDERDARDYTVAACWEYIIPGKGMEVVNVGAVSFPAAADAGIRGALKSGGSFDDVLQLTEEGIREQVRVLAEHGRRIVLAPAPFYSVLMDGCLESARDLSKGAKYNNFGFHGACSANAADALAAVKKLVFGERSVRPDELLVALESDFDGHEDLRRKLLDDPPKVGTDEPGADEWLAWLFERFADACDALGDNGRGGRFRPGTGSAMYYVWLARKDGMREPIVGATADGRKAGQFFSSSLAPSPAVRTRGPLSVLKSFAKVPYGRVCNGGPITMELSDTVFRSDDSIRKVAQLVQLFVHAGCQELQLNTLNVDTLRDAKAHPDRHRNLIVRVWGWSGYFCELDECYQDHIIARHVYGV